MDHPDWEISPEEQRRRAIAEAVAHLNERAELLRERRDVIRLNQLRRDKRQQYVDYCRSEEDLSNKVMGIPQPLYSWEMTDPEFEDYLEQARRTILSRYGMAPPPAEPKPQPTPVSSTPARTTFGRRGL